MDTDFREFLKKYGAEAFGWSGSVAVLVAYGFATYQDKDSEEKNRVALALANMYGSSAIAYVCYRGKVWQALMLEVAWFSIAFTSLVSTI